MKTEPADAKKFPGQGKLDEVEPRWFAVNTRYKSEKMVGRALEKKGISYFIPVQKITKRYTRKIRTYEKPLLNCYAFVKITVADYVPVLETEHVYGFVKPSRELMDISEKELEILRRISGESLEANCEPGQWQVGELVEIASGNLAGLRGYLDERTGKREFVVNLETLGHVLKLQVDTSLLRKVEV